MPARVAPSRSSPDAHPTTPARTSPRAPPMPRPALFVQVHDHFGVRVRPKGVAVLQILAQLLVVVDLPLKTIWTLPSSLASGWRPAGLRSMMERRRWRGAPSGRRRRRRRRPGHRVRGAPEALRRLRIAPAAERSRGDGSEDSTHRGRAGSDRRVSACPGPNPPRLHQLHRGQPIQPAGALFGGLVTRFRQP